MNNHFFLQDKVTVGLIVGLGSMAATALLLTAGLSLAGEAVSNHLRWYGAIFIPLIFFIRYYVKQQLSVVTKTLFIVFFLTFLSFIFFLFKTQSLTFNL